MIYTHHVHIEENVWRGVVLHVYKSMFSDCTHQHYAYSTHLELLFPTSLFSGVLFLH